MSISGVMPLSAGATSRIVGRGGELEVALAAEVGERAVLLALVGGELHHLVEVARHGDGEVRIMGRERAAPSAARMTSRPTTFDKRGAISQAGIVEVHHVIESVVGRVVAAAGEILAAEADVDRRDAEVLQRRRE